jgi:hypothetical protein
MTTKECPNCGNTINVYATKCKYCDFSMKDEQYSNVEEIEIDSEEEDDDDVEILSRKDEVRQEMQLTTDSEQLDIDKAVYQEELRRYKKEMKRLELESSWSYNAVSTLAKWMDKYCLDPFIGFIPGVGDILPTLFIYPFIHISIFKIKSLPLTLAVVYNTMVDWLLGMIPYVGIVADFFNRSFRKNMKLIVGFVEDDKEIIQEVNSKAITFAILIVVVALLIWWLISAIASILSGIADFVGGLFS